MGEMFKNHGRSRAQVLDGNHGIERVVISEVASPAGKVVYASVAYLPWYYDEHKGHTYYYTRVNGWHRVEYDTWQEAFDHVSRSRRMLTSKQIGSNYVQEARNAGVELPETQSGTQGVWVAPRFLQANGIVMGEVDVTQAQDVLTTSEQDDVTYGLLVSNVGWVRQNCPDYEEVKALFVSYSTSKEYDQVTMWASNQPDPIEEAYSEEIVAELTADPWCHPQYDAMAESQAGWDV